jgi:hypothetical protein
VIVPINDFTDPTDRLTSRTIHKERLMDKPLNHNEGIEHPPSLLNQILTVLIFTGGIALLATLLTYAMAFLVNL